MLPAKTLSRVAKKWNVPAKEIERRRRFLAGEANFREFVDAVRPGYRWFRHCERLRELLEQVEAGLIKRLMIFMPPRHGKSELASRLFAAWYLYRHPEHWVGMCSHTAELAYSLSRAARENYTRAGGKLDETAGAVKHWQTPSGGGFWAAGVGGAITGKGWHLGIIDDPVKNAQEAQSSQFREGQKEWYGSTFYTREEPGEQDEPDGALIVIQTRWHEDDLAGWLLSQETDDEAEDEAERWHIVNLPAIREEETPTFPSTCTVEHDWREVGEALCPERRPVSKLARIRRRVGEYYWAALFQQSPKPKSGQLFQREWFAVLEQPAPEGAKRVRYWDLAATKDAGAWTAGVLIAQHEGRFWVEDVQRGRWDALTRNQQIRATAEADRQRGKVRVVFERERGGAGKEVSDHLIRELAGFTVEADLVSGDKVSRAEPLATQAAAGNVSVVRGDWNAAYLDELCWFPFGRWKDQVDASSGAFNQLCGPRKAQVMESIW